MQQSYIKLTSFYSAKESINKTERQPVEWEKIFAKHICDKRLITKIHKSICFMDLTLSPIVLLIFPKMILSQSLSHVQLFETPWTVSHQAPLSMEILQARILEWVAISFSKMILSAHISESRRSPVSKLQKHFLMSFEIYNGRCFQISNIVFQAVLFKRIQYKLKESTQTQFICYPKLKCGLRFTRILFRKKYIPDRKKYTPEEMVLNILMAKDKSKQFFTRVCTSLFQNMNETF